MSFKNKLRNQEKLTYWESKDLKMDLLEHVDEQGLNEEDEFDKQEYYQDVIEDLLEYIDDDKLKTIYMDRKGIA